MAEARRVHPEIQDRTIANGGTGIGFDNTHLRSR
jgi:hypothetical protein